jgi:hypothetical protein
LCTEGEVNDLAALKALYEAATKGEWYGNLVVCIGDDVIDLGDIRSGRDAAFICAAHTHWLELLAMAEECKELRSDAGQWSLDLAVAYGRADDAEAEKAAMAKRLGEAEAALRVVLHLSAPHAKRMTVLMKTKASCEEALELSTDERERLALREQIRSIEFDIAAIAAHEAERGKE